MLELRNISFGYEKAAPLYESVNLSVEQGQRVALQAPSGFGKTTLCRIAAGYLAPRSGEVLVDGEPLPSKGTCPVQLILQHPEAAVDPRMRMAAILEEAGDIDEDLLALFGIRDEWLSRFPHELSGGELQRFCIVRALMTKPRYLIADEISTMLDPLTQLQIWQALLDVVAVQNMGLMMVSHSTRLTDFVATRVVDLTAGR
ncbi:ABC transporter ATP-binding protein [Anaerotardibacter muris]|uniref:ABC transporter ATP-binding protein n=1 Tax=Anaerotardibacter muris TaxID=2941505 RepID=UPI0020400FAE|nr:ATP-binding cassette domain-containing protein [Anaerotardibacter muris]